MKCSLSSLHCIGLRYRLAQDRLQAVTVYSPWITQIDLVMLSSRSSSFCRDPVVDLFNRGTLVVVRPDVQGLEAQSLIKPLDSDAIHGGRDLILCSDCFEPRSTVAAVPWERNHQCPSPIAFIPTRRERRIVLGPPQALKRRHSPVSAISFGDEFYGVRQWVENFSSFTIFSTRVRVAGAIDHGYCAGGTMSLGILP